MTTAALEGVARARLAQTEAATSLESAQQANSALLVRLSEAKARIEEAVRETKAGGDALGKWAMQLRLSTDDQGDIQNLLNQSHAVLNTRSAALSTATAAVTSAQRDAHKEEVSIHAIELDSLIVELESKLCEAIKARLIAYNMFNPPSRFGSQSACHKFYTPSRLLKNIVERAVAE
jgi:hypothetical protein